MIYGKEKKVDYLAGSKPSNIIPESASLDEMVYYVLEDSENNFNEMMKNLGISELNYFLENGVELDYTVVSEGKLDGIKEKIAKVKDDMVKWLEKFWAGFQEMIQKTLNWLSEKSANFKSNVLGKDLKKEDLDKAVKNIKKDKDFGSVYTFAGLDGYMDSSKITGYADKVNSAIDNFTNFKAAKVEKGDDQAYKELEEDLDNQVKTLRNNIVNGAADNSAMMKAIKKEIRGDKKSINGAWVISNWNSDAKLFDTVANYSTDKKTLKKNYDVVKNQFNKAIKAVKTAKEEKLGYYGVNAIVKANSARKKMLSVLNCAEGAVVAEIAERYRQYSSIVLRVASAARAAKKAEQKAKHESAPVVHESSVSTVDMLNSLFEW